MEVADTEPNPEPDDKIVGFLGGVSSGGGFEEESCWDLMDRLAVLGWDYVWRRRWGLLMVRDERERK